MRPVFQGLAEILFYDWLSQLYWSLPAAPTFATSSLYTNNFNVHKYAHTITHTNTITKTNTITNTHTNTGAYTQHCWSSLYFTTLHWPILNLGSLCCTALAIAALSCFFTAFYCSIGEKKVVLRIYLLQNLLLYT